MTVVPQITFRNMDAVPGLEEAISKELEGLTRFFSRIVNCHVTIEGAPKHDHLGPQTVRIELSVPGDRLVVKHSPHPHTSRQHPDGHEKAMGEKEIALAVHQAFHELRRQLQDYARRLREPVGSGLEPAEGF